MVLGRRSQELGKAIGRIVQRAARAHFALDGLGGQEVRIAILDIALAAQDVNSLLAQGALRVSPSWKRHRHGQLPQSGHDS